MKRRRVLIVSTAVVAVFAGYTIWANLRPYRLETSIEIDASRDAVWTVLTDLQAYPEWNPFIIKSSGEVREGATLTNTMRDATGDMTFTPTVLVAKPGEELRWLGKVAPGGIFDGEHRFVIEEIAPGRVRLVQSERFTGVLIPFFQGSLEQNTLPQFRAMNEALAARAEALS